MRNTSITSDPMPVTLESIAQRKADLKKEIRTQKEIMANSARDLFAPLAPAVNKGSALMRTFNTGMVVFDGVMLGLKLMRKFRKLFFANK